jgi:hypothetical protein
MPGKSLKGSKSHTNLKEAFAGESQANRRYLYFARVADRASLISRASPTSRVCSRTPRTRRRAMRSATSIS